MSIAEIERFAADLKSNAALMDEAEKAAAETSKAMPLDRAVAFAANKGYAFTAEEAKERARAKAKVDGKVLTDAELDDVAGGITADQFADFSARMEAFSSLAAIHNTANAAIGRNIKG